MFKNIGLRVQRISAPSSSGSTVQKVFPYFMEHQTQSNWCWSACATSVGVFLATGKWTQCDTATGCIKSTTCYQGQPLDCCKSPAACNCYGYLDISLDYTASFNTMLSGTYPAAKIEAQINDGLPVCVRVAWYKGGAHFLAMTGYSYPSADPSAVTIYLQDSIYGASSMLLSDFAAHYQSGGTWTHTYLTKR